ncbi:MAG: hypothetical protein QM728_00065 [Gordonia sp. (in: high G+C Gram-positive bacteria)]|uniref:hypothetical protein n=1 Tax=Gordonia sp. (in: high G+C Gram-positive bacteria) TaxID=84139 RepID=UPI0039E4895D
MSMTPVTLLGRWGYREQSVDEVAALVRQTVDGLPAVAGVWVEMQSAPAGSDLLTRVPVDVTNPAAVVQAIRRRTDERWGGPNPPHWACDLYLAEGERFPLGMQVAASDSRGKNSIELVLRSPELTSVSGIDKCLRAVAEIWDPDWLSTWDFDLILKVREHGGKSGDIQVGWKTYLSDRVEANLRELGNSIQVSPCGGAGRIVTLSGSPSSPDLDQVLGLRKALGYAAT